MEAVQPARLTNWHPRPEGIPPINAKPLRGPFAQLIDMILFSIPGTSFFSLNLLSSPEINVFYHAEQKLLNLHRNSHLI